MATVNKSNNVSALVPEFWSPIMQAPLRKSLVAGAVANTQFEPLLNHGDTVHFPYWSTEATAVDYTPGTAITTQDVAATDETLVVDKKKVVPTYVDNVEELQTKYSMAIDMADNAAYKLKDDIDTATFVHVSAAASGLYYGGTAEPIKHAAISAVTTAAITATTSNIIEVFTKSRKALRKQNVEEGGDWIAVLSPEVMEVIELTATNKGFNVADATLRNGYVGTFLGFKLYISNNLPGTYCYIGRAKMIHLATQQSPRMEIRTVSNKLGRNFLAYTVYGTKLFTKYKERFLTVNITT